MSETTKTIIDPTDPTSQYEKSFRIVRNSNIEWILLDDQGIAHMIPLGSLEHTMKELVEDSTL